MTARRLYTEEQIIAALTEASFKHGIFPATGTFLKELRGRGETVLFTKNDLLAVAVSEHEKIMVHGIFAAAGTRVLNEAALMAKARDANLGGNMEIMIRVAAEALKEDFQDGDVVLDAKGKWYQRREGDGTHPWVTFGNGGLIPEDWPKRPLKKMN